MNILFTKHVLERMQKRKILKAEVVHAILYSKNVRKKTDTYFFQSLTDRGKVEVCAKKEKNNIKVITVYWL